MLSSVLSSVLSVSSVRKNCTHRTHRIHREATETHKKSVSKKMAFRLPHVWLRSNPKLKMMAYEKGKHSLNRDHVDDVGSINNGRSGSESWQGK